MAAAVVHFPYRLWRRSAQSLMASIVGDIVPRDQVPAAVMANGMSFNMMRSIGPALGGLIIVAAGATAVFAMNSMSYVRL